ncbi:MAG: DUF503 domain-containing protein [Gemmatimonadota bacterium]
MVGEVDLFLPESHSLKEKRQVIKSVKDRIRSRFNVSVAEVDHVDLWQRCALGLAVVSSETFHAEEVIGNAIRLIEQDHRVEVVSQLVERW